MARLSMRQAPKVGGSAGLATRIMEILAVCGNAWAAADLYEELSRLSDAELHRRGIPRGELHRCIFAAVTRRTQVE